MLPALLLLPWLLLSSCASKKEAPVLLAWKGEVYTFDNTVPAFVRKQSNEAVDINTPLANSMICIPEYSFDDFVTSVISSQKN